MEQEIRFCRSYDGTSIAYAVTGGGPPLVMAPHWFGHLELNWQSPAWRPWLLALSRHYRLLRMDERGSGLSDREVGELSFEALVRDLDAAIDAAGYERFALYGGNHGGAIAIEYAARHPQRVTHLVLFNAYARGWLKRGMPTTFLEENEARLKLIELGWEREESYYREMFLSQHVAEGTSLADLRALSELARKSISAEMLIRLIRCMFSVDVSESAKQIRCPTLVMHAVKAPRVPFEEGRVLARLIPGARLAPMETANNILLEHEAAFAQFFSVVHGFLLPEDSVRARQRFAALTARESEILERIAQGLDNAQIAAHLELSEKTVRNYVTQIFDKLGVENRAQAIVLARESGLGGRKASPAG